MVRRIVALAVVVVLSAPALADNIENPLYASWAKAKVGTEVTLKTTNEVAGQKTETVLTYKLTALTADVATVELTSLTKAAGQEFKSEPTKMENKKLIDLPPGTKKEDALKQKGQVGEGDETLKIGGKEYKTKWVKTKMNFDGTEMETKSWSCDDVPGLLVKMETKTTGETKSGVKFTSSTVAELVGVKGP